MATIDYGYKSRILKTNLCKRVSAIDKQNYLNCVEYGVVVDKELDDKYFNLLLEYDYKDIVEARKINKASHSRIERLRAKITDMITSGSCVWCTFTFTDNVLSNTSENTRKQYVRKFLKSFNTSYIANIDFGDTTEREHYHALVSIDRIKKGTWPYGFDSYEKVRVKQSTSCIRLSKYISKLTNHYIKESTRRCAIIYSST